MPTTARSSSSPSPALLCCLASDAEAGSDVGPGVTGLAESGRGFRDGVVKLCGDAGHLADGVDVPSCNAAAVGGKTRTRTMRERTKVPGSGGSSGGAAYRNRTDDLRITRVFPCVARGSKGRLSIMFAGGCRWRSLAVDGSSGASQGHAPVVRRPGSRWGGVERPSVFQAGHIPSWRKSCESYALSPVADDSGLAAAVTVVVSCWPCSPFPRSPADGSVTPWNPKARASRSRPGPRGSSLGLWLRLLAPAEVLVVLVLCVRRFAVVSGRLIGVAHRLSLGFWPARGCWWPRWKGLSRATGGSFRRKCAALLIGSGSGVRFRSEQGKSLNPRGFSGFSPSSARAAGDYDPKETAVIRSLGAAPIRWPGLEATASNDQRRLDTAL